MNKLPASQVKFAREYVANGMVGPSAYMTAFPNCKSRKAARSKAWTLLHKPVIRRYIQQLIREEDDYETRRAELKAKMNRIDRFNLLLASCDVKDGMVVVAANDFDCIADEIGDCVVKFKAEMVEATETSPARTVVMIELMDKDKNFDRLREYYDLRGSNTINLKVSGGPSNADLLEEAELERNVIDAEFIVNLVANA